MLWKRVSSELGPHALVGTYHSDRHDIRSVHRNIRWSRGNFCYTQDECQSDQGNLSYEHLVLPLMLEEAAVEKVPYPHFVGCDFGLVVW